MSNLLEQASLVLIPSGYKEDVVYSQIPLDGSGDLQLTRASNGTRVNSAGLVEVTPWNVLTYSEQFTNAAWVKQSAGSTFTLTDNFTTAPNGTTTACKYTWAAMDSAGKYFSIYPVVSNIYGNLPVTCSIYMKGAVGGEKLYLYGNSYESLQLVTLTTEWVRYQITFDSTQSSLLFYIGGEFGESGMTTLPAGTAYIWGAQLNIGATAKPYFPTTDRLNVPRLTYQNGGGGCPSLLLEKQSTNQYTYSEDLTQWTTSGSPTITANDSISPDGTTNADRVEFNASTNLVYNGVTGSVGTNVLTVYAKAKSGTAQKFRFFANGTINFSSDQTATDQWQRFEFVFTYAAVTAGLAGASTGASDVLFWGFQHEVSSYATSYIPTTSASATRVADACSKTGISSLIGQTEGVLFAEFDFKSTANTGSYDSIINIATNVYNSIDVLKNNTTAELYVYAINGGTIQVNSGGISGTNILGRHKIALAYKANDYVCYLDGVQVFTDTSATVPACSNLYLGAYLGIDNQLGGTISQLVLFKTRLTNAELASLTTL
jgi:hypothetical protein